MDPRLQALLDKQDITELIQESVPFALRGSKSRYQVEIDPDLWTVNVDEGQISQVLNNILINADQAMPSGGDISISARVCEWIPTACPSANIRRTTLPFPWRRSNHTSAPASRARATEPSVELLSTTMRSTVNSYAPPARQLATARSMRSRQSAMYFASLKAGITNDSFTRHARTQGMRSPQTKAS